MGLHMPVVYGCHRNATGSQYQTKVVRLFGRMAKAWHLTHLRDPRLTLSLLG